MSLKVAVLVTQVPDHEALVRVESDTRLEIEDRYVCSFFDEIAIEAALALAGQHAGTELIALAAGGRRAVDALRRAMAMGIDQLEHIEDDTLETGDGLAVALALAARLRQLEVDLVLCGQQAGDDEMGAVGPMVAALLGVPHAGAVVQLNVDPVARRVTLQRQVEGGSVTLEGSLPLLACAGKGLAEPHVPVVTRVLKAMRAKPAVTTLTALGLQPPGERLRRQRHLPPPARPPVTMHEGTAGEAARSVVESLRQAGVLES
jgi:electron transfer flavoprotein beta subunit